MKICMFTNTYLPHVGGVARSVAFFAEDLRRMGHSVLIVAPTFPGSDPLDQDGDQQIIRVPAIQNFNGSDFSVRVPLPFILDRQIDAFKPEVIHSHHPYLLGDAALRAARQRGLPLVFTHHTLYEKYTHYVPLDSEPMRRFVIQLSTAYANLSTRVVAPSRSLARLIRRRGVTTPVDEIPTGVDVLFFRKGQRERFRKVHHIAEDTLVIGHLGRLAPEKNLTYLAEAVARFLESNRNARFLVAGDGPSAAEIRRIFEMKGLGEHLVMAGVVTGSDLSDVYKAMDIFVFASRTETQGMVLVEAMAAGKPVIALDASGTREVVEDSRNGRLLPGNASCSAFAKAIDEAVRDEKRRRRWQNEALKAAETLSREACAERLMRLYAALLGSRERNLTEDPDMAAQQWGVLLRALETEWELFSEKAAAMVGALKIEEQAEIDLD